MNTKVLIDILVIAGVPLALLVCFLLIEGIQ